MSTTLGCPLSYEALETAACTLIGRLILSLSQFETDLALYLQHRKGLEHTDAVLAKLENSGLHAKLDMLETAVRGVYGEEHACVDAFKSWIKAAHEIRETRNELVHGRWGIKPITQQVVNVIGLPGSPNQRGRHYSLQELEAHFTKFEKLTKEFYALTQKWPLQGEP
jgi:hypothetical protein